MREADLFPDLNGINLDAAEMFGRGVILRVNGEREGLNGAQVQGRNLLCVRLLALEPPQILTIRAEDYVHQREHKDRNLPTGVLIGDVQHLRNARADHIVRECPEITGPPDITERLVLGQRDNGRNWESVRNKIDARHQGKQEWFAE